MNNFSEIKTLSKWRTLFVIKRPVVIKKAFKKLKINRITSTHLRPTINQQTNVSYKSNSD